MHSRTGQPIPAVELREVIEPMLAEYFGTFRRITTLHRRRSAYSSSNPIENLGVELARGPRLRLVFKDLSPSAWLPGAQHVRPRFLFDPQREIEVYRKLLRPRELGTPVCYGAIVAPASGRYWLFLERVTGPLLWQVGDLAVWEQAARWLARLHAKYACTGPPRNRESPAHLLRYDVDLCRVWLTRAEDFLRQARPAPSAHARRRFRRLVDRYDRVLQRLFELPTALVHGEFYPSNVLVRRHGRSRRICPVDWEMACLAPGLLDLAALTAGQWTLDDRRRMVAAYRDEWSPTPQWPPSLADLMEAVAWCQLHLAIQLLGWAQDWSPPQAHARNWLREALTLAQRLAL